MPPVSSTASARTVLQSGSGPLPGRHYLPSRPDEVHWGWLPNAATAPVMEVSSGDTITIDTVSREASSRTRAAIRSGSLPTSVSARTRCLPT